MVEIEWVYRLQFPGKWLHTTIVASQVCALNYKISEMANVFMEICKYFISWDWGFTSYTRKFILFLWYFNSRIQLVNGVIILYWCFFFYAAELTTCKMINMWKSEKNKNKYNSRKNIYINKKIKIRLEYDLGDFLVPRVVGRITGGGVV